MIVAVGISLLDRGPLDALGDVTHVRTAADVTEAAGLEAVVLDLSQAGAVDELGPRCAAAGVPLVGFGSHVDTDTLAHAEACGAVALARSVFFRRVRGGWRPGSEPA